LHRTLSSFRRLLVGASLVGIALATVGGWLLAGRALRPVDRITATAAAIATERATPSALAARLDVPASGDEVARLAATFNQMLDRIEQAFAAQRRFIADASHELRTPLTAIRGNIDVLLRQATLDEMPARADTLEALADVRREASRMARLLEDLLTLARADAPAADSSLAREPVPLDEVARDALQTARGLATGQHLTLDAPAPVVVLADPDRLQQLVLILLENAIRHTPPDGTIAVTVERTGNDARLTVRDTGEGIAPEHLPHIFERFYRADTARDRSRGGTGLGLAIAQAMTRVYGGDIGVVSTPGQGSAFTVTLPAAPVAARPAEPGPAPVGATTRKGERT
jgi:signal transduction histidine kinase